MFDQGSATVERQPSQNTAPGADDAHHLRSEQRESMFLLASARRPRGVDVPIKVRNLSPGGLMAECPGGFVRGDTVHVDLRGIGTVAGHVAWTAAGRIGVQFDETIDHRQARMSVTSIARPHLVQAARSTWRPSVR